MLPDQERYVHCSISFLPLSDQATGDEFLNAVPDPVAPFQIPICRHMNVDHPASNKAIVEAMTGFEVDTAELKRVDRLGVDFSCTRSDFPNFICRVPFSR